MKKFIHDDFLLSNDRARELYHGFACEDTMLYVHVSNLRRKLGPAAALLSTSRNAGYSLSR